MKNLKKWLAALCISLILATMAFIPNKSFAMDGAAIAAAIYKVWDWMQNQMMAKLQQYQQDATNKITGVISDNFKEQTNWEKWPASLKSLLVTQMVPLENKFNDISYKNAVSYVNYTQGKASGVEASKYPVKALNNFNQNYNQVQEMNVNCNIKVPQVIGDTSQGCTQAQVAYTNTMLSGVNPLPTYPESTLNTAIGQQYVSETNSNVTRTALSQLALDQATNPGTNEFIDYMHKSLQKPTVDEINNESSAAIARDTLILNQARAMLELRIYEATLMNERLLATLVAQHEEAHLNYIRKLGQNQAQALHH